MDRRTPGWVRTQRTRNKYGKPMMHTNHGSNGNPRLDNNGRKKEEQVNNSNVFRIQQSFIWRTSMCSQQLLAWGARRILVVLCISPPARWGLLDFMSIACSSPPLLSSSSCSTATLDAQCSLSDLNHDHPRPVFPAGPQPRPSPPSVPCRTSTTTIHAQCSLPDLNREYPRQVFPAGPHVGRYGTKNVQKKVRKNVRQVCYILLANSRVCGRVTGAMPLLTLQVAKFEAISLNICQKICQIECQKICQIECQKICQIECQKICQ